MYFHSTGLDVISQIHLRSQIDGNEKNLQIYAGSVFALVKRFGIRSN